MEGENEGKLDRCRREGFLRGYHELPSPSRRGPQLWKKGLALHPPLPIPSSPPQQRQRLEDIGEKKKRRNWSDKDLREAINALECGYKLHEVCEAFNIRRFTLKEHYNGDNKKRKMSPKSILTKEEEEKLVQYVIKMERLAHPLTPNDFKLKVAKIC